MASTPLESLRDAYARTLISLGEEDPRLVVVDADLSSSTRTILFQERFPERFFNTGISEQNLMGMAAGLALCDRTVFASTFAVFATGRAWDQVRQSICYNQANVKIVATHGGITVGEDGATHQSNEDVALMRVLPNMRVIVPSDSRQTEEVIRTVHKERGPFYVRLSREEFPVIHESGYRFALGRYELLKEGRDTLVLATGKEVSEALTAARELEKIGKSVAVADCASVKPLDEEFLLNAASRYPRIVVAEEHQKAGGFASAVAEFLSERHPVQIGRIGLENVFGVSGKSSQLMAHYGLDSKGIYDYLQKFLG